MTTDVGDQNGVCDQPNGNYGYLVSGVPNTAVPNTTGSTLPTQLASPQSFNSWYDLLTYMGSGSSSLWSQNGLTNDMGVLFEVYNEPALGGQCGKQTEWNVWRNGSVNASNPDSDGNYIGQGIQDLVSYLRGVESPSLTNMVVSYLPSTSVVPQLLLVPALAGDHELDASIFGTMGGGSKNLVSLSLAGAQDGIADPGLGFIYAIHPYPKIQAASSGACNFGIMAPAEWDTMWGTLEKTLANPVAATEWYSGGDDKITCSDATTIYDVGNSGTSNQPPLTQPANESFFSPLNVETGAYPVASDGSDNPYSVSYSIDFTQPGSGGDPYNLSDTLQVPPSSYIASDGTDIGTAALFLNWLSTAGSGGTPGSMTGAFNFDTAGDMVDDFASYLPTSFPTTPPGTSGAFACGATPIDANGNAAYSGPGALLKAAWAAD